MGVCRWRCIPEEELRGVCVVVALPLYRKNICETCPPAPKKEEEKEKAKRIYRSPLMKLYEVVRSFAM